MIFWHWLKIINLLYLKKKPLKMKGINYLMDDKNEKVAVQIDLQQYG